MLFFDAGDYRVQCEAMIEHYSSAPCKGKASDESSVISETKRILEEYNKRLIDDVKPAFQKFDLDGSGAIDKEELVQLLKTLGIDLDEA